VIRSGYNEEVDELRDISGNAKKWLDDVLTRERESSGIKNLRIGYNKVFGYFLEVTKSYVDQVPYYYQRKQTLTNAERYITPELKDIENRILTANERLIKLEAELYDQVKTTLVPQLERLEKNAQLISRLDVYAAFAQVAVTNRYVRPEMGEDGVISIRNGRHPIVERSLQDGFIPNDVLLDRGENRLLIITGPNMAGKSTYMRMVALITLMAHMGAFVPAEAAHISLVDRIFTRIGASDDLSSGQSTFMVEMSEVANILNNATKDSLLILDEIGRGTSTYDGLSIAWAVLEYIASEDTCGAKALFATHYHELSELEGQLSGVKNYRISVKEIGDNILFLRKIVRGSADKSFGVQVARLAGIPEEVILRAGQILEGLESSDMATMHKSGRIKTVDDSEISVDKSEKQVDNSVDKAVLADLKAIDLENMTPMMALQKLYAYHDAWRED
jgi:DNA mismatch repair protein MutS